MKKLLLAAVAFVLCAAPESKAFLLPGNKIDTSKLNIPTPHTPNGTQLPSGATNDLAQQAKTKPAQPEPQKDEEKDKKTQPSVPAPTPAPAPQTRSKDDPCYGKTFCVPPVDPSKIKLPSGVFSALSGK